MTAAPFSVVAADCSSADRHRADGGYPKVIDRRYRLHRRTDCDGYLLDAASDAELTWRD